MGLNNFVAYSAIQYLSKHMYVVYSAAQGLVDFFTHVLHQNWIIVAEKRTAIKKLTQQAHLLQQQMGTALPREHFVPITRPDIIGLLQLQTLIANKAQAITVLVLGRQLTLPPAVGIAYFPLLNKSIAAVQQAHLLINHLDDLTAPQGKKKVMVQLAAAIDQLDTLENTTDHLQVAARNVLLGLEQELSPIDVVSLYKLLEWTGDLADRAHDVGGRLISVLAD